MKTLILILTLAAQSAFSQTNYVFAVLTNFLTITNSSVNHFLSFQDLLSGKLDFLDYSRPFSDKFGLLFDIDREKFEKRQDENNLALAQYVIKEGSQTNRALFLTRIKDQLLFVSSSNTCEVLTDYFNGEQSDTNMPKPWTDFCVSNRVYQRYDFGQGSMLIAFPSTNLQLLIH